MEIPSRQVYGPTGAACVFGFIYAQAEDYFWQTEDSYNGAVPKRSTKFNWTKPVDGSNPETEWQGYLHFDDLRQLESPKCGFLQNCNQSPLSTTPVARELRAGEADENPKASEFAPP